MGAPEGGPWLEPAEAEPRLLLLAPPNAAALEGRLERALAAARPAAFVVADGDSASLESWREVCGRAAVACLVRGDAAPATRGLADGVQLADPAQIGDTRRRLGPERLIGCEVGLSRHDAMVAGEEGADYLLFGSIDGWTDIAALRDLLGWWSELFVLPAAATLHAAADSVAGDLLAAGADFLAVGGADWAMPGFEGRLEALAALCAAAGRTA